MSDSFDFLVIAFSVGLGLSLLGVVNAFLRQRSATLRIALSMAIVGLIGGAVFAVGGDRVRALQVSGGLTAVYGAMALLGSSGFAAAVASVGRAVRNPLARWSAVGVLGLFAAVGGVTYSESEFQLTIDREMADLEVMASPPPSTTPSIRAVTDLGRDIVLKEATEFRSQDDMRTLENAMFSSNPIRDAVIRMQPADDRTNCHGWVLTGGRYWVSGEEVTRILAENGYLPTRQPHPGDLVIYRSGDKISHTAIVRYVTPSLPVLVEGKWGCTSVFLHPVDKSIYGDSFIFYRSARKGHVLAGLESTDPSVAVGSPHVVPDPSNPSEFTE